MFHFIILNVNDFIQNIFFLIFSHGIFKLKKKLKNILLCDYGLILLISGKKPRKNILVQLTKKYN